MSISTQATFESGHTDQIHDCQYDYYGRVRPHARTRRFSVAPRPWRRSRRRARRERPRDPPRLILDVRPP